MNTLIKKLKLKQYILLTALAISFIGSLIFVYNNHSFYDELIAEVIEISVEDQRDVTDEHQNEDVIYTQQLVAKMQNGDSKGKLVHLSNEYSGSGIYQPEFHVGDDLFISIDSTENNADLAGSIIDVKRDESLLLVTWVFIFVLIAIGRRQGFFAIISLLVNAALIAYALDIYIKTSDISLLFIMSITVIIMTVLSLLFISGFNEKTYAAIVSTLLGTFVLLFITIFVLWLTDEQGLRFEEMAFLSRAPQAIFMAGVLVGALGAVMDVGVTMSSSLFGLYEKNHRISVKDLKESGLEIGKDIMGTMTNILFFAYVSGTIPTLLLYFLNDVTLGFTLSMNLSLELTRALAGGIGIVLTIPIGLYTTIFFVNRKRARL
ncbi:YibE/F family protein [Paraliobacillus sediminis]|uniref:YibE/F family protein n=1 Tax=Paraliobacillus sediminis TaxID=1885916 RepID=UPI000E3DCA4F|nr:YibE/F family protein [Paraliobacillus sediminis]